MNFSVDKISKKSIINQYFDYLDDKSYLKDLKRNPKDVLSYQLLDIKKTLVNKSVEEQQVLKEFANVVCGSFEKGIDRIVATANETNEHLKSIDYQLADINESINNLHLMLDWKLESILDQQKITNEYLGKISRLLKIPDSQKQRAYHVEQGLIYLKSAISEGRESDFYADAFEEFINAERIENRDYFTLHRIGYIHLNSPKQHSDIENALDCFKRAAKYARAAAYASQNVEQFNQKNSKNFTERELLEQSASALIMASRCCYILADFKNGINFAEEASEIEPSNLQYKIQLAKLYAAENQSDKSVEVLQEVLLSNPSYFIEFFKNSDFNEHIIQQVKDFCKGVVDTTSIKIKQLRDNIIENSQVKEVFGRVNFPLANLDFSKSVEALKVISLISTYNYKHYDSSMCQRPGAWPIVENRQTNCSLADFILLEREEYKNQEEYKKQYSFATDYYAKIKDQKETNILLTRGILLIVVIVGFLICWVTLTNTEHGFVEFIYKVGLLIAGLVLSAMALSYKNEW